MNDPALPPSTGSAFLGGVPKGFTPCHGCTDDTCGEIKECLVEIYKEADETQKAYVAKGICSDCGACSLKDAARKCRPQAVGETGEYSCEGETLWQDQEDE